MGWYWGEDGKMHPMQTSISEDSPWVCHNLDFDCYLWNRVFFHTAAQQQMVHTHCQTCFKVVVAPRNFLELLELKNWQQQSGLRCKAGIEVRDYVTRTYGGYFYSWEPGELKLMACQERAPEEGEPVTAFRIVDDTDALRKGREKYEKVCRGMNEVLHQYHRNWPDAPRLDKRMPVLLKRGCTEFEAALGPTNQPGYRHISDDQVDLEATIEEQVAYEDGHFVADQPKTVQDHIVRKWCDFAHFIGDMTYVQWLGHQLSVPPVTYHEEE